MSIETDVAELRPGKLSKSLLTLKNQSGNHVLLCTINFLNDRDDQAANYLARGLTDLGGFYLFKIMIKIKNINKTKLLIFLY
jgi:hypothetical protein